MICEQIYELFVTRKHFFEKSIITRSRPKLGIVGFQTLNIKMISSKKNVLWWKNYFSVSEKQCDWLKAKSEKTKKWEKATNTITRPKLGISGFQVVK